MSGKAREALSEILDLIDKWRTDGVMEHWQYSQLFDVADNALAEPLKNSEVGTAEEQVERFDDFCLKHIGCVEETGGRHCVGCPLDKASMKTTQKCELYWAQMPYESEVK